MLHAVYRSAWRQKKTQNKTNTDNIAEWIYQRRMSMKQMYLITRMLNKLNIYACWNQMHVAVLNGS